MSAPAKISVSAVLLIALLTASPMRAAEAVCDLGSHNMPTDENPDWAENDRNHLTHLPDCATQQMIQKAFDRQLPDFRGTRLLIYDSGKDWGVEALSYHHKKQDDPVYPPGTTLVQTGGGVIFTLDKRSLKITSRMMGDRMPCRARVQALANA